MLDSVEREIYKKSRETFFVKILRNAVTFAAKQTRESHARNTVDKISTIFSHVYFHISRNCNIFLT